jgi:ferredoxin
MRITVVDGLCQGHARCVSFAPEIFDLDADGYSFVVPGRENISPADEDDYEQARLAVENCPEQAIRIDPDE